MGDLLFGNIALSTYGAFFDGSKAFAKPAKDVDFISVAGRNGDLSFSNNRYSNIDIHFNCFIPTDFISNYADIINVYSVEEGYQKLLYTTEDDIYREAQFVAATDPKTGAFNDYAQFDLVFNCKPQKFLRDYDTWISLPSSNTQIQNEGRQDALPIFRVQGNGTLYFKDYSSVAITNLTVAGTSGYTLIDCELQDAYWGTTNKNQYLTVSNGFPVFERNGNAISYTGFTSVEYRPRFWRL